LTPLQRNVRAHALGEPASLATVIRVTRAETGITAELVRDLLRDQHPDLADRPLSLGARGWDDQLWRLYVKPVTAAYRMTSGVAGDEGEGRRWSMFERFTDRARRVVVQAQEEARTLDHNYLGTEHLLLALTHESIGGVAAKALESLGIGLETVRQQAEEVTGRGEQAPSGHIPFTPQAKKALELALQESRALGHNYIGTEHILLGLIREGDGVAARVLTGLGADLDRAREQVIRLLDEHRRKHGHQTG
jgi:hypothetical protein